MKKALFIGLGAICLVLSITSCKEQKSSLVYSTGFENFPETGFKDVNLDGVQWMANDSTVEVASSKESESGNFLHLLPGVNKTVSLKLSDTEEIMTLSFNARALKQPDFKFRVETLINENWTEIYNGDKELVAKNRIIPVCSHVI